MDTHCHERAGVEALEDEEKWGVYATLRVAHVLRVVSKTDTTFTMIRPTVMRVNAANTLWRRSQEGHGRVDDERETNTTRNPLLMQ
jgi:hypothetical protein